MQLPEQMSLQAGAGGIAVFKEAGILGQFALARGGLAGSAGEVAQVILPIGISGGFLGINIFSFAWGLPGFRVRLKGVFFFIGFAWGFRRVLFQAGIFQELLLHHIRQFQPGKLEQFDGLLQLRGHGQLLAELHLLS